MQGSSTEGGLSPRQASEECLCGIETRGLHEVRDWLMDVNEVQERAVLSWPQNQASGE